MVRYSLYVLLALVRYIVVNMSNGQAFTSICRVETQRYEYTKLQRVAGQGEAQAQVEEQPQEEGKPGKKPRSNNPRLTEERRRRLEAIGFEWKVKNKMKRYYDRQWDSMYEKLMQYKAEHGHWYVCFVCYRLYDCGTALSPHETHTLCSSATFSLVPKRYPQDIKLGTWVHTQRIQYRKMLAGTTKKATEGVGTEQEEEEKNFRLTEDRRRRLDEAGFVWSVRDNEKSDAPAKPLSRNSYDDQWDAMFERLKEYKERHGVSRATFQFH